MAHGLEFHWLELDIYVVMDIADKNIQSIPSLSILLAEDNPINQRVAIRMLKHLGYHADVVTNGYEVIEAIAIRSYDLILMDVQMPKMNGVEATRQIRHQENQNLQTNPIAIVAITANSSLDDQNRCQEAGMCDYLTKPIEIGRLKSILARYEAMKQS